MITLKFLLSMWKHNDKYDRVSLWECEVCTGRWLGQFPVDAIPEEYQKRLVKSFELEGKDEELYDYIYVTVE